MVLMSSIASLVSFVVAITFSKRLIGLPARIVTSFNEVFLKSISLAMTLILIVKM